ncbi:hypothetical protein [Candidatus Leptofilum sp.]|uniref:hypothetical protein n=1 Tax=Candidatus Leptofilum sp. TaxID=3241576 RepID=UPI003B5AB47A
MSSNGSRKINRKRLLFSLAPLVALLLVLIGVNLLPLTTAEPQTPAATAVSIATQPATPIATSTRPPILLATILPSPTPTITPRPTVPPEATIHLFGPPNESTLPLNGRIAFFWQYSEPLLPGQELLFTLRQNDAVIATSRLNQPNFGTGYQILLELEDIAAVGTAVWQVNLQWEDEKTPLLSSENRSLLLLSE